ncbi:MAG: hypothetical protein AAGA48_03260 [Myxococcota bacterium]
MYHRFLALVALVACAGDDILPIDTNSPSPSPTGDTGPAMATGSTGSVDTGTPPDPEPETVTVRALTRDGDAFVGEPDLPIVFNAADGSFVASFLTDETGTVTTDAFVPGGSVSFVRVSTGGNSVYTFDARTIDTIFGIEAGDVIESGGPERNSEFPTAGRVDVDVSAPPTGGTFQEVFVSCGGRSVLEGPPATVGVGLWDRCAAGPVEVLALDYETFARERARSFAVTTAQLGGMPLEATAQLNVWSDAAGTLTVDVPNGTWSTEAMGKLGNVFPYLDARYGAESVDAKVHSSFSEVLVRSYLDQRIRMQVVPAPPVGTTTALTIVDSDHLPAITVDAFDLTAPRPTVSIGGTTSATCGTAPANVIAGELFLDQRDSNGFQYSTTVGAWTFLAPVGSQVSMPDLGPDYTDVWPTIANPTTEFATVVMVASPDVDYADYRSRSRPTLLGDLMDPPDVATFGCQSWVSVP